MAKQKYIDFTVEELIHNQDFIKTVKNIHTKKEWQQYLEENSKAKEKIILAHKIIFLFKVEGGKLQDEHKYKLWRKIIDFNRETARKGKVVRLKRFSSIAASILIVISIGTLLFLNSQNNNIQYQFAEAENQGASNNTILVLSNGKKIELKKNDSKITVLKNKDAVQINNDSIVEYQTVVGDSNKEEKLNEIIVPFGRKTTLVLDDGTKVWLNAGSSFAFPQKFVGKRRTVFLEGEGYFEVAKNKNKPFIVSSNNINIEVLGTRFNMSAYKTDDFCETILLEGSINVWGTNKLVRDKVLMKPNQKAVYKIAKKEMELKPEPDADKYIAWIEGWYQFSNVNLEQVLTKIERYYNVKFQYNKQLISEALPVTGKLDLKESLEEVMFVLSRVAKIEYKLSGNIVIIKK